MRPLKSTRDSLTLWLKVSVKRIEGNPLSLSKELRLVSWRFLGERKLYPLLETICRAESGGRVVWSPGRNL